MDSIMWVNNATSGDSSVECPPTKVAKAMVPIRALFTRSLSQTLKTSNPIIHSPSILPSHWLRRINDSHANLIHLHWVQGEMLSIADIGQIRKSVVWTLHDMWAFCGAEHLAWDDRWRDGYCRGNRPPHESGFDLNCWTWQRKRKYWHRPFNIVCPSQWLANCVRSSALMHTWPVTVVPNPIDTSRWQPVDQCFSRKLLGLPQHCRLLLFGAFGGVGEHHKGFDLLLAALTKLHTDVGLADLELVVFGQHEPQSPPKLSFPVHYIGHLHDDVSMRALYSAADALVIPSRQDNLPNTGLEAQACGTPVVAFNTCGLPDIVDDRTTGVLAEPFEPASLAAAISWVLDDLHRLHQLGHAARFRAERLWNPERVSGLYADVYRQAIQGV